jgi:hypothetical protein
MKYKIKKLQGGGLATFTPIVSSTPVRPMAPQESAESGQEFILDEDLYKELIKEGGLKSDVNLFVDELIKLESTKTPFLNSNNRSNAIRMIGQINALKRMRED